RSLLQAQVCPQASSPPFLAQSSPLHRHDPAVLGRRSLRTVARPCVHQLAALLEHVATPVRGFDLAPDDMRQRHLGNLAREVGARGYPVAEARPKAVCRQVAAPHPPQQLKKRLLMQRSTELAGEDESIGIAGRARRTHLFQNVESGLRKWHAMLFSSL